MNNIALSDKEPNIDKVKRAAKLANIDDWVETLPLEYDTRIGMEGHGISSGQRQRILIARAAYKDAPVLFFDEATNSLDANNEKIIMNHLSRLFIGKTIIIVAHRLSTIKNADQIIVLEEGNIKEIGNHGELLRRKGEYYNLVKAQLAYDNLQ